MTAYPTGIYLFVGGSWDGRRKLVERRPYRQVRKPVKNLSFDDINRITIDSRGLVIETETYRLVETETYRLEFYCIDKQRVFFYVHESLTSYEGLLKLLNGYRQP